MTSAASEVRAARRAVVLVHNTLVAYSRAVRFARTLAEAGWDVTLAGLEGDGQAAREHIAVRPSDPADARRISVVRVAPSGPLAPFLHERRGRVDRLLRKMRIPTPSALMQVAAWPLAARAWGHGLRALPPADLYHACGIGAAFAARDLAARARRRGRAGRLLYDMIDIFLEANRYPSLPRWRRSLFRRREAALVRDAAATVTVNDALAADATSRWTLSQPPLVVPNAPSRAEIPATDLDLIRAATGIPAGCRIVVFLGRFVPDRGLLQAGDAVLLVPDTAFVALGYGRLQPELRARDAEPERRGRHYTLPPVPPDEVPRWAASADASIFVSPGSTLNIRLSTPNKLWESLAGGAPVVYGRELEGMRDVLEPLGLGVPARHDDVPDIAAAIRTLLDVPEPERRERRERARRLVRDQFAWDVIAPAYLGLVDALVPLP
jgi:glycosyltransferase involved in cell wall biosynthesis